VNEKILSIDAIRIDRKKPRKCVCKERHFTIDTVNRELTCECGIVTDPFEVLMDIHAHFDRIDRRHQELYEQRQEWLKTKPHSVMFKNLERSYQRVTMLPSCPKCEQMFDFKDITFWSNAEFYRKLEQSRR
jgi:hypothetical protein